MNAIDKKFHHEIEVERLRTATRQGQFAFFSILTVSIIFVFLLWEQASHSLLLTWFTVLTMVNFLRWISMQFYHTHKEAFLKNLSLFKLVLMIGSICTGTWWAIGVVWFLDPSQLLNVMMMSIYVFIISMGAILAWYCYLPAVLAILAPPAGTLAVLLIVQGSSTNVSIGIMLCVLAFIGAIGSMQLARMLNHALELNFENVALRQKSEEKSLLLETALENMDQGISMSDKDDRLRMWNQPFIDLLGSAGDPIATDMNLESLLQATIPPIKTHANRRTEHQLPDGRVFEIRQTPVQQGGRVLTYHNISGLIKRERALEEARATAVLANAAKTRFLAAASHDLRQPIHALGLFFGELSDRVHSPETDNLIMQIHDSIEAINSMLNALLDVSKLDAGIIKPNFEYFTLTNIFNRLESELVPIALEKDNQLHIRHSDAIIRSDPAMLEQMLRNLISNAIRYTEIGRILVAARPRGEDIEIQVIDNGPGIPKDQQDDVFIEFYQVGNPARDRRQGLGLGLAIVKRQANLLGHKLKLVTHLGRGCCFSITLPKAQVKLNERQPNGINQIVSDSLNDCTVLVLDDDHEVLAGMRGLLTRWGCQVITANSPDEAFDQLGKNPNKPELFIIDYRLPNNVSGIEVAKQLQSYQAYSASVLIITGDTGPERLREADASGYPLLHKPVQPAKLRSTMQYLLSKQKKTEK